MAKIIESYIIILMSFGYRVSSKRATAFRQKATKILKSYIVDGYAINERGWPVTPKHFLV